MCVRARSKNKGAAPHCLVTPTSLPAWQVRRRCSPGWLGRVIGARNHLPRTYMSVIYLPPEQLTGHHAHYYSQPATVCVRQVWHCMYIIIYSDR
jgi:hypothetical protein